MRRSTATLARSQVLLADLTFPHSHVHIQRTRLPFIHLENVLHYAKIDRDGQVDGYIAVYLPDELTVLFLNGGVLVNAVAYTPGGRSVVPIAPALRHIKKERERGELMYCAASNQQLAWMFRSCSQPATRRFVDQQQPEQLIPALSHEVFSGVLELISASKVNYLRFEDGEFVTGEFSHKPDEMPATEYVESLFAPGSDGAPTQVAAAVFTHTETIPEQAPPELIQTFRELFWSITSACDAETSGMATKQAIKYRDLLSKIHPALAAIGQPLDRDSVDVGMVATPQQLTSALAEWTMQFLEQVEILAPGSAPAVLKKATREQRFVLQKTGYYDGLPWTVRW